MNFFYIEGPDNGFIAPPYEYPADTRLSSKWRKAFRLAEWSNDDIQMNVILCPENPLHRRTHGRITDLTINLRGAKVGDFHWTWYSELLATERVTDLLLKEGFTGFEPRPVTIRKVKTKNPVVEPPSKLWEIKVTGQGGEADPACGVRLLPELGCEACNMKKYSDYTNGIIVNEKSWDGSDFFTVIPYPKFFLITERVKEFIMKNGFTNCLIVNSRDLVSYDPTGQDRITA
jgi:hypothetical protein